MVNDGIYTSEAPGYTPTLVSIDDVNAPGASVYDFQETTDITCPSQNGGDASCAYSRRRRKKRSKKKKL